MAFDRKKADEAANTLSLVVSQLSDAGLETLSLHASDLMDRLEAVLEGDNPRPEDFE